MKKQLLFITLSVFLISGISNKANAQTSCPILPFAVVELFTSQGCSYCKPAGKSLDSVIAAEKITGRNVICISEHVTYNGYGWTDPFADAQFSPRQTVYCQYVGVPKGTPECFINGRFIAAPDPRTYTINPHINNQLGTGNVATAGVCLTLQSPVNDPTLTVAYDLSGNTTGANLIVCLVEDDKISNPTAGENQGATLHEDGVSRQFIVTPITTTTGTVTVTPPANCVRSKSRIYAYVQNPTSMYIRGATKGIDLANVTTGAPNLSIENGFNVYPNPAINELFISYTNNTIENDIEFTLVDISGRIVASDKISNGGNGLYIKNIDAKQFSKGIYMIQLNTGNELINKKIIIN